MASVPPPVDELVALSSADVRAALLARGIGLSEAEVAEALSLLKERAVARTSKPRGRLAVSTQDTPIRAGAAAPGRGETRAALEYAVDWFARTFFVGP
jgi:hypothetical protein